MIEQVIIQILESISVTPEREFLIVEVESIGEVPFGRVEINRPATATERLGILGSGAREFWKGADPERMREVRVLTDKKTPSLTFYHEGNGNGLRFIFARDLRAENSGETAGAVETC